MYAKPESGWTYEFWERYLSVFDEVAVIGRVSDDLGAHAELTEGGWVRASGQAVTFIDLPDGWAAAGPMALARSYSVLQEVARGRTAILLRCPSVTSTVVHLTLPPQRPYAVEVNGDPYDMFAKGASSRRFRRLYQRITSSRLRKECEGAAVAAYVTERALQARYPAVNAKVESHYTSASLMAEDFADSARWIGADPHPVRLVAVGRLDQPYKGMDVLIEAVAIARACGVECSLTIVGDGALRNVLERQGSTVGVGDIVSFAGAVPPGAAVRSLLGEADVFVQPSRQEGLSRALLEAMAMGMPCIGTRVGGTPEVLPPEATVPCGDAEALGRLIVRSVDAQFLTSLANKCYATALTFSSDIIGSRREHVYSTLYAVTDEWYGGG